MKNKIIVAIFLSCLLAGLFLILLLPDAEVSRSERRRLAQFPPFSLSAMVDKDWTGDFEEYLLDQFPARDTFRSIKAYVNFYLFRQSDNNGVYLGEDGHVFKNEYPLNEASVTRFAQRLNAVYGQYLQGKNVYYTVVPDKARYSKAAQKHLLISYERQLQLVQETINGDIAFIDIFGALSLDAYYHTDIHWRQERLQGVVDTLGAKMGFTAKNEGLAANDYFPFYGGYYGQAGLNLEPDTLVYLTGSMIDGLLVEDFQYPDRAGVYYADGLGGMDSYDVYLNGATPLITITNPAVQNGRTLVIFRDSFTSSLAPLLAEAYETITLVDLRYISSALVGSYVDFESADDVLFIYGEQVLNNSAMLR